VPAEVIARRGAAGGWLVERGGVPLDDGSRDTRLHERLEELIASGRLHPRDRIRVVESGERSSIRRIEEFLGLGVATRRGEVEELLRAERWAGEEDYH
jgi:hypothetical protein